MKFPKVLIGMTCALAILAATGYYYVFYLGAPQLDRPQEEPVTGLNFKLVTFTSQAMGGTERNYGLILPPDYEKSPKKRYPVIFLLHGGHDNSRAFYDKYALADVLKQLYASGALPPSIIITPDGNDNRGSSPLWDPDYFDGPNGKIGTLIGSELVQLVKSRYRTWTQPQLWAIGGVSSGGGGAINIGLRHLNNFSVFFSHSDDFLDPNNPLNSPQKMVQKLSVRDRQGIHIYLDAGLDDHNLLASTKTFHETLDRLDIDNVFNAFPGGHGLSGPDVGWNYFHKHLTNSLTYAGKYFKTALARTPR